MKKYLLLASVVVLGVSMKYQGNAVGIYPPTNGVTNPAVTQENIKDTICKSGWTATIRPDVSYTNNLKLQQLDDEDDVHKDSFEEDHIISLQLGGHPTDPNNLWPEPYEVTANGKKLGARQKDIVETYLKRQVCSGKMLLKDAQYQIGHDWVGVYKNIAK